MPILHVPRTSKNNMHQSYTFMLTCGCLFTYSWLTCVSDECWDLDEKAPTSKNTWDQIADQLDSIGSSLHHVVHHKWNRTLLARPSKKVGMAKRQLLDTQGPRGSLSGSCWRFLRILDPDNPRLTHCCDCSLLQLSHKKTHFASFYFPLNPGCLIGILVMVYLKKHIQLGSCSSPIHPKQPGALFFINSTDFQTSSPSLKAKGLFCGRGLGCSFLLKSRDVVFKRDLRENNRDNLWI